MVKFTEVEGPGLRAAIWLQGCSIRCRGCCNPSYIPFEGGKDLKPDTLAEEIATLPVEGITILGGEPLDQASQLSVFLIALKRLSNHGTILFTGYTWASVISNAVKRRAADLCDLVIAGPYVESQAPDRRQWIGSKNQTLHFLTNRYAELKKAWPEAGNQMEIRLRPEGILVSGTPCSNPSQLFFGGNK